MRDITPLPHWMNAGFSSYSIWWLLCHYEWYRYHGNKAYLEQSRDYITALLRQLMTQIAPDGQECLDGTRFWIGHRIATKTQLRQGSKP